MAKLGYTWYPKDWGNSESVFEMNLSERGLYRELIDLAMLNDNKTEIKIDVWARKFAVSTDELKSILGRLSILNVIEIKGENLFIPSCETRLNLVRGGSLGGKNGKPNRKPMQKPFESLSENNLKPTPKQIESKVNITSKEIISVDDAIFLCMGNENWILEIERMYKVDRSKIHLALKDFKSHCVTISEDSPRSLSKFQSHFTNWVRVKKTYAITKKEDKI